jgi:hypothetical protein
MWWKIVLIIFFAINAVFWSLFPHSIHCKLANTFLDVCPAHNIHLTIGIISFIIAFIIAQYDHLKTVF